jgi:hypothetical protein
MGRNPCYFPIELLQQAAKEVQGLDKNSEKVKDIALRFADKHAGTERVNFTQELIRKLQPSSLAENGLHLIVEPLRVIAKTFPQPQQQFQNHLISARNGSWSLVHGDCQPALFQT